jgi:hypothetical protein
MKVSLLSFDPFHPGVVLNVPEAYPASDPELHRRPEVAPEDSGVSEPVLEASPELCQHGIADCYLPTGTYQDGGRHFSFLC